jgi:sugar lactone lactonase YvrE
VAVDAAGNVYVTDRANWLVRKITAAGVVSTLAGSVEGFADGTGAAAKFEGPTAPCVDAAGNIYIADIGNNRIRQITPAGLVSSIAGGATLGYADGPVATARFQNITSIAVDAAGNLYVADEDNNLIRKVSH